MLKLTAKGIKKCYQVFEGDAERAERFISDIEENLAEANEYLYSINVPYLKELKAMPLTDDTPLRLVISQSQIHTEFITLKYGEDYKEA